MSAQGEQRKTVTIVFCDLAGSTALGETVDPERLRALLAGYFERMKGIVERHGGTVEKFIGDAVMAVFGVPVVHEDDALRAVRAASEMREALPELGLEGRIGVMTGEVVTGTEERLATGDAVNVAARLEAAAEPGDVLLGQPTLAMVRDAVEVEALEPLLLKGKRDPLPAYRLVTVHEGPERRHDTPFVGRDREVAFISDAWNRVVAEQRCELVTVVGEAGVGKSRLVAEAVASLDARVVQGRCPPYGDGITYWPVVEVLIQLGTRPTDATADSSIAALLGESDAPTSADEIAWAFRKTLEHAAATQPLLVVFDDIQWAEDMFRDLVEHVALLSTGAPILLLCVARPELVEERPGWPVSLRLEPLPDDAVDELMPQELPSHLRDLITRAAGGNPLFIGEMLAMSDATYTNLVVPPSLQALLAARLDQLQPGERAVLEHGAIEGEVFHRGAVHALASNDAHVTSRLAALVRKGLIRPERAAIAGEDAYRFRHILLRDAAYDGLAKTARADLHERLAGWLEHHAVDLVELDELLGHHLERAYGYRRELNLPDDRDLAAVARRRLSDAGQRAARRQDYRAAVNLLERAAALGDEVDLALEAELADVLFWAGRNDDACARADALAARASDAGDRVGELCGRVLGDVRRLVGQVTPNTADALNTLLAEALPVFEAAEDDVALYVGFGAVGEEAMARGHADKALEAWERAFVHARNAGYDPSPTLATLAWLRFLGSTPVSELLAWLDTVPSGSDRDQFARAYRAWSLAKLGRFDESRAILEEARAEQAERGGGVLLANLTAFESVGVEMLAGDPARAAEFGAEGCRMHEELGEHAFLTHAAAGLAHAFYALGRFAEAERWAERSAGPAVDYDTMVQMSWRQVKAKLLARRGEHGEALRLAHEATSLGDSTDMVDQQGDAYADLGEVLELAEDAGSATTAYEQALDRYERKGNLVMAERTRKRLSELESTTTR